MSHPRTVRVAALGAAMLLVLASCGSEELPEDPTPSAEPSSPAPDPTADETPADSGSPEAGQGEDPEEDAATEDDATDNNDATEDDDVTADFSTEPQESEGFPGGSTPGDEPNHLVDIRSGVHEGFERVVFEFDGDGLPSWRGEYTDSAAELGRGRPIEIAGDLILEINVNGPSWMMEEDEPAEMLPSQEYYERDRGGVFEEIFIQGPFENHSQYLIGTDQERPFQVQLLEDPVRIVVDIATEQ